LTLHCPLVIRKIISLAQKHVSWVKNLIIGTNPKQDKHKGNKNQEGRKKALNDKEKIILAVLESHQ